MLSVTDLLTIQTKPLQADVSLFTIQEFYEEHLCNRLFIFETDDTQRPIISLRFEEANFCHLLGIQHVFQGQRNSSQYVGQTGYDLIKNNVVTFNTMNQKPTKKNFKDKRNRMLYFPFVHQILKNPTSIIFSNANLPTNIDVDIILYNHLDNKYLHLGVDKENDSQYYHPKTFFDRSKDDFIVNQKKLTIKSIRVELDEKTS
ncbi:hypothetical protein HNP21_006290 [Bacillus aryabhattai]|uniref:Phage-Barnase-EndoU-ColicinE5/D-RelE like nuclease 4 domain-containing protein n=1 Tax=Priestia aryabhattai TaxID=412384 RepID=A0A7W3RIU8_PRIAR|nr:PBECR4 domain-containing protein [Priestia aryabhattai]MBA9043112.1 hypothetical protein [Priestia aryabhattai]